MRSEIVEQIDDPRTASRGDRRRGPQRLTPEVPDALDGHERSYIWLSVDPSATPPDGFLTE